MRFQRVRIAKMHGQKLCVKCVTKILFRNLIHMFAQPIFLSIAGHKMAAWNCQLFRPWLSSFLIIFLFQWASLNRTWKSFTRLNSENNLEKPGNRVGGRWLFPKMYPWIYENKYSNCIIKLIDKSCNSCIKLLVYAIPQNSWTEQVHFLLWRNFEGIRWHRECDWQTFCLLDIISRVREFCLSITNPNQKFK